MTFQGFGPRALTFLRGLRRNNRKDWFEPRREVYQAEVRAPMLAFIEEMDDRLGTIAPEIVGDPRRSMFRIHRDVRFSPDKSPYKTHAACWFHHRDAGNGVGSEASHGGAGFYFHVEPGASMLAGGIWMPPRASLNRIREAIGERYEELEGVTRAPTFRRRFGALSEEAMLTRMPRGFAADHPAGRWLRYCSFTVSRSIPDAALGSRRLVDEVAKDYARMLPLIRWLNSSIGLPVHGSR